MELKKQNLQDSHINIKQKQDKIKFLQEIDLLYRSNLYSFYVPVWETKIQS